MSGAEWRLDLARSASRDLNSIPEKATGAIFDALHAIEGNPHRLGKPLTLGFTGFYVARRGPYRIIYEIDASEKLVRVIAIGHRRDVYRSR